MKNLFDRATATEIARRIDSVQPNNARQWGKMTAPQALAHCANAMEWAVGERRPPRMFLGRIIGGMVRKKVVSDDRPIGRNSPTARELIITDNRELATERVRLRELVERFSVAGPNGCTSHPHTFFGKMTPDEWAVLMYKHVDHHLRQFGA
jgi:uncharacterized protein DUF1569